MAKPNLTSMSIDALLKLRDDISRVLDRKADQLKQQLASLDKSDWRGTRGASTLKGRRVPIKYRDKSGNTWTGRGVQPVWLREKLKSGAKLEDFAVQNSHNTSPRKSKKQRKAKR